MHEKYKDIIWLLRGSQRKKIFLDLPNKEFTPNKLRKEQHPLISLREMSRHLKDFKQQNFIQCLNEKDPYNKIYIITNKGKKLKKQIKDFD